MITDKEFMLFFNILEIVSYVTCVFVIIICIWISLGIRRKKKGLPDFKYFPIYNHEDENKDE